MLENSIRKTLNSIKTQLRIGLRVNGVLYPGVRGMELIYKWIFAFILKLDPDLKTANDRYVRGCFVLEFKTFLKVAVGQLGKKYCQFCSSFSFSFNGFMFQLSMEVQLSKRYILCWIISCGGIINLRIFYISSSILLIQ